MYSKRSPPTVPAGIELPHISIPCTWGIAPSTGISRLRRYSSILGALYGVAIREFRKEANSLSLMCSEAPRVRTSSQPTLIARNHDCRASALAFGQLTSGGHADFEILLFSADDWAIEIRLVQSILEATTSCATAMARLQISAGTARLWRSASLYEGRSVHNP